jgi:lysophospholipase L1-like esterase
MTRKILGVAVSTLFIVITQQIALAQPTTAQPAAPGGRAVGSAPPRGRGFGGPIPIGPPAPVPPQVAMLRPSADELAQIREAWKKFADADTSSVKPLLEKYASVLNIDGPRANTAATYTQTFVRGPRHQAFVDIAAKGDIDLLLEGDSITDWWVQNEANKAMFEKYFGNIKTANFAVAGDTTQGVLWGLKNGEGQGFSPKAIMLMIGTNNMGSNTPPEIAEGIGAVVMELRKDFPDAKILLLAIFPRSTPGDAIRDRIAETNKIISRLDDQQRVFYMDIGPKFLDEKGAFLQDSFRGDNLHPQAGGYDIWGAAVKEKLDSLMK